MSVIGISNLILDYYFFDNQIYINGGGTVSNILCNLSSMGIKTKIFGYYGNDKIGNAARGFIEEASVDTSLLEIKNYKTKCFFINKKKTSSTCPYCGVKRINYRLRTGISDYLKPEDIVLIQDYTLIDNITNKICLDCGYFYNLIYLSNDKIEKFIFKNYYIVNLKEQVLFFILKKLNITFEQFKEKINIYLLIITKGKKGATIIFNNKIYDYHQKPFEEKETNGCGDVFFATFLSEVIKRENINEKDLNEIYYLAQQNVFKVINNIGARNHIVKNKRIECINKCICEDFKIID